MDADRADELLETDIGDGRGVFRPADNAAIVLNQSAARIWDLVRAGLSRTEVAGQVAAECCVDADDIRAQVDEAIDELARNGLLPANVET